MPLIFLRFAFGYTGLKYITKYIWLLSLYAIYVYVYHMYRYIKYIYMICKIYIQICKNLKSNISNL